MKQVKQLLILALCCVFSLSLSAQVYEVNLAGISKVNLTLNDDCEALLIREMVLTGDYDVVGDGQVPGDELFRIVVEDSNPANGPIIDECGSFVYRVEGMDQVEVTEPIVGFQNLAASDAVDIGLFFTDENQTNFDFFLFGTDSLVFTSNGSPGLDFADQVFVFANYTFTEAGVFTADYTFDEGDLGFDAGFVFADFEGNVMGGDFIDGNFGDIAGSVEIDVVPGSFIDFVIQEELPVLPTWWGITYSPYSIPHSTQLTLLHHLKVSPPFGVPLTQKTRRLQ